MSTLAIHRTEGSPAHNSYGVQQKQIEENKAWEGIVNVLKGINVNDIRFEVEYRNSTYEVGQHVQAKGTIEKGLKTYLYEYKRPHGGDYLHKLLTEGGVLIETPNSFIYLDNQGFSIKIEISKGTFIADAITKEFSRILGVSKQRYENQKMLDQVSKDRKIQEAREALKRISVVPF